MLTVKELENMWFYLFIFIFSRTHRRVAYLLELCYTFSHELWKDKVAKLGIQTTERMTEYKAEVFTVQEHITI